MGFCSVRKTLAVLQILQLVRNVLNLLCPLLIVVRISRLSVAPKRLSTQRQHFVFCLFSRLFSATEPKAPRRLCRSFINKNKTILNWRSKAHWLLHSRQARLVDTNANHNSLFFILRLAGDCRTASLRLPWLHVGTDFGKFYTLVLRGYRFVRCLAVSSKIRCHGEQMKLYTNSFQIPGEKVFN